MGIRTVNKVILLGTVGERPVVNTLQNGKKIATFHLATDNYYKKNGESQKETDWHNIVAWENAANIVEAFVKKGGAVYIEGRVKTRDLGTDGDHRYYTEVVAEDIIVMSEGKKDGD